MSKAWEAQGHIANTVHGDISNSTVIQGRDIHVVHLAAHEVDWPVRVGTIPEQAAHYQHRAIADQLDTALNSFGTVVLRQVLSGTGGVGKTQLAARHARTLARITNPAKRLEVLVWAHASSREQITYAYAQAARQLYSTVPDDLEGAAQLFLTWLQDPNKHQNRRWLIVWDDLADPAQVQDLWPPYDQPHGRVLVTTRRRDHALTTQGRHLLDVDIYTPGEARAFLARALDAAGIANTNAQMDTLSRNLGHLPLALGQAVTYMAELAMGCEDYLQVFHDRLSTLDQVFPDWENPTPLAATWTLSLTQADTFNPKGMARPLMGLIALLDGTGIPEQVLIAPPVLEYLAAHRSEATIATTPLSQSQAHAALANLRRWNLISRTTPPSIAENDGGIPGQALVSAHQLVQRATREHTATRPDRNCVRAAADAHLMVWPEIERDTALAQRLRNNTTILRSHHSVEERSSEEWLWIFNGHKLLFRMGRSLDECGQTKEAIAYWNRIVEHTQNYFGPRNPNTLIARNNLAAVRGKFGDTRGAAATYETLIQEDTKILGSDHPETLTARSNLAYMRGESGDPKSAVTDYEKLLKDQQKILGPDHFDTLTTRNNLAHMRGASGDITGAVQEFTYLFQDRLRILGPSHPETLNTRLNLVEWRGNHGDTRGAVTACEVLLADQHQILGPDHPSTLRTRQVLAEWRGKSGDTPGAVSEYEDLLADRIRILGPDHPYTLDTRHNLATWRGKSGDLIGAITTLKQLLQEQKRFLGPDHAETLTTRGHIAIWTFGTGAVNSAIKILSDAIADQKRILGHNHPDTQMSIEVMRSWMKQII